MFFFGRSPDFQPPNSLSNFGLISLKVTWPTITSVELFGLNQVSWNFFMSDWLSFSTDTSVPEPVNGLP